MTWSPDDITDAIATQCERDHNEPNYRCGYCPTREDIRMCGRCEEVLYPHDECENCLDEAPLITDGFGRALVTESSSASALTGDVKYPGARMAGQSSTLAEPVLPCAGGSIRLVAVR